jgi:hypothetical protein
MHTNSVIVLLKEVLLNFEEYGDSQFTDSLVKVKEIADKPTSNQNLKDITGGGGGKSRMKEPVNQ